MSEGDTTSRGPALAAVLTSIQAPTPSVRALLDRLAAIDAPLFQIGDAKGPAQPPGLPGIEFLGLDDQRALPFALARALPTGHYARKQLGYLLAIERGARSLFETDDDNAPLESWAPRALGVDARPLGAGRWHNTFRHFGLDDMWPRGLPVPHTHAEEPAAPERTVRVDAPLQTALIDGAPDIDVLCRLARRDPDDVHLAREPAVLIPPGSFAPVNTQSTWWWPRAYPFLYLPSSCTFRMTDIWRGFVAQRCLWELDAGLVVHAPEMHQDRNPHDHARDWLDELPGHLLGDVVIDALLALELAPGDDARLANLRACHEALVKVGAEQPVELERLDAWCEDLRRLGVA